LLVDFTDKVVASLRSMQESVTGHLSLPMFKQLLLLQAEVASEAASYLANTGDEKKRLVIDAIGMAFDTLWPRVPLPLWLAFIRPIVGPVLRRIVLAMASGEVEFVYQRVVKVAIAARDAAIAKVEGEKVVTP